MNQVRKLCQVPVAVRGVLDRQVSEFLVDLAVEVVAQEERPEAVERVHFGRLANAKFLSLYFFFSNRKLTRYIWFFGEKTWTSILIYII
jgi:hypothetical protein